MKQTEAKYNPLTKTGTYFRKIHHGEIIPQEVGKIVSFYSKKTHNKYLEIERFENSYVFWTYTPNKTDIKLFSTLPYSGSNEITIKEGEELIKLLSANKKLYFD